MGARSWALEIFVSLVPRPSTAPVFDRLHTASDQKLDTASDQKLEA